MKAGTATYMVWPGTGDGVALTLRDGKRVQIGTDDARRAAQGAENAKRAVNDPAIALYAYDKAAARGTPTPMIRGNLILLTCHDQGEWNNDPEWCLDFLRRLNLH